MKIFYKYSDRKPYSGDIKILKDGTIFFRKQLRTYFGAYVVSNGNPVCEWYSFDDPQVEEFKRDYLKYGVKKHYAQQKKRKTKVIYFDFAKASDRKRYEEISGIPVSEDTTVKTASLRVYA